MVAWSARSVAKPSALLLKTRCFSVVRGVKPAMVLPQEALQTAALRCIQIRLAQQRSSLIRNEANHGGSSTERPVATSLDRSPWPPPTGKFCHDQGRAAWMARRPSLLPRRRRGSRARPAPVGPARSDVQLNDVHETGQHSALQGVNKGDIVLVPAVARNRGTGHTHTLGAGAGCIHRDAREGAAQTKAQVDCCGGIRGMTASPSALCKSTNPPTDLNRRPGRMPPPRPVLRRRCLDAGIDGVRIFMPTQIALFASVALLDDAVPFSPFRRYATLMIAADSSKARRSFPMHRRIVGSSQRHSSYPPSRSRGDMPGTAPPPRLALSR